MIRKTLARIPVVGPLLRKIRASLPARSVSGRDNRIDARGAMDNVRFDIAGNGNEVRVHPSARLRDTLIFVRGDGHRIEIAEHCFIGGGELWIEDAGGSIVIERETTIEHAHLAVTEGQSIRIGADCMIARDVEIRTGDSHSILDQATGARINPAASVDLEPHVWVGGRATILKGVRVGRDAVIGTGSLVTSDVPPGCVVGGVPAKVLRSNTRWDRRRL